MDMTDDVSDVSASSELELIDMPSALTSATPKSNLERRIALQLVYDAGPR